MKEIKLVCENDIEIFTDMEAKVGAFNEHSMNYSVNRSIVTKLFLRPIISSIYTRENTSAMYTAGKWKLRIF